MKDFKLMILTAKPELANYAQDAGVDRIFYDLEYLGKAERQRGRDTVKSNNSIEGIPAVRKVVTTSELLVRTNPIHAYSKDEVDRVIDAGADSLMLPMAIDQKDVAHYLEMVNGRAKVIIMIETAAALARIDSILALHGIDEIFVGLNDLHISLGLSFMFEPLSGGLVEYVADKCKKANVPFGFGGIAKLGEGLLPAEMILGEHVRLGSSSVILSRAFKQCLETDPVALKQEVFKLRERYALTCGFGNEQLEENRQKLIKTVNSIVFK